MPHDDAMPDLFGESLDDEFEEVGREEISLSDVWPQVQRRDEGARPSETGCLGCSLVGESPVSLRGGTVVCSACPEWRHECEVRHLANMETKDMRVKYLAGIEVGRGKIARQRLIDSLVEWGK
jgi:hypothetical protein